MEFGDFHDFSTVTADVFAGAVFTDGRIIPRTAAGKIAAQATVFKGVAARGGIIAGGG